jgi:NAD(P)-dependent dehydrogenase (short-subunit alcohol dehydrogenase family)
MGSRNAERGQAAADKLLAEGLSVEPITIDVTDDSSITAAAETVKSKYGRLDVLVNNAGIEVETKYPQGSKTIRELLQETYDTNVFGAMQTLETFAPLLEKAEVPRVVFVSSHLSCFGKPDNFPGQWPVYRSSKTALNMLLLSYSHQYREKGWKINATCPGYLATNLNNYSGYGSVDTGAINAVRLATLGKDGETGTFSEKEGPLPW